MNGGIYNAEGQITKVEILNGGSGYTEAPSIELIGGGGKGAKLKCVVSEGKVIDILILEGGSGYINNNITVSIRGDGEGAEAKAYANFGEEDKLAIGLERGKAYVQGFEIEKVGTTYVTVPKARDYLSSSNLLMTPKVGNFVYVTNLCGIPSFGQMAELEIYDQMTDEKSRNTHKGNLIGTCRVRGIDWSSGVLHDADRGVFRLYLFDINLKSGYSFGRNVKSFYMSRGIGNFSANISPIETSLSGTISVDGKTVTGVGTSFLSELKTGDYIRVYGQLRRVEKINTQSSLTLSSALSSNVTGQNYYLVTTTINEPQEVSNIVQLPTTYTKNVLDENIK